MVQRKAARFVFNDYSSYSSVTAMLQEVKWNSLQDRRIQSRLIMFYKILNNLMEVDFNSDFFPSERLTRGHQLSLDNCKQELIHFNTHFYQPQPGIGIHCQLM